MVWTMRGLTVAFPRHQLSRTGRFINSSSRLLQECTHRPPFQQPRHPSDGTICRYQSQWTVRQLRAYDSSDETRKGDVVYGSTIEKNAEDSKPVWTTIAIDEVAAKPITSDDKFSWKKLEAATRDLAGHVFPANYPHSVAPGYLRFTAYYFTASVAGSAAMVLSTQSLLLAVGVVGSNAQQAGIMAGAFNWVMKDFMGQLGGVIFASQMGKTRAFDADPKRWRMVAAMTLDGATLLEILSPLFPTVMVLPIASIANVGKNVGFLTASASRASVNQALALAGNLGDVTAKAGSQAILASLVGTSLGIGLSSLLSHDSYNFALGFCVLACIHQGCNYLSLQSVPLSHFNRQRLHIVLDHYLSSKDNRVLCPNQVAGLESYFPLVSGNAETKDWLSIGSPLTVVCPTPEDLERTIQNAPDLPYIIRANEDSHIHVVFRKDATGEDIIQGTFHAYLMKQEGNGAASDKSIESSVLTKMSEEFPHLLEELHKQGWQTGTEVTTIESREACRLDIQNEN
eukprot:Nitzschia sp. Nitz4//scaffold219_size35776//27503//29041//NITZ4_007827-RA/size35776-processed-gene-0.10-mRNA-1//1//CDS//3329542329//6029//frame0